MKIVAIFYTDEKYRVREPTLIKQLDLGYGRGWLKTTDFYFKNRNILDMAKGGGYWLWKPYIIIETMKWIEDGDVVFYVDAGDDIGENTLAIIKNHMYNNDYMISGLPSQPINRKYIKKDCFVLMGADTEEYYNTPQNEAGVIAFKKTRFNEHLLNEWLFYCQNENILTDIPNIYGENDLSFIEHRHDQAVLSILTTRHKMDYSEELYLSINFNVYTPPR